ncbi:MAG: ATP-binding protein [Lachnospiraceae bacterium]|nr:ATP-binding protein [Lachnospiraceae bacterium]
MSAMMRKLPIGIQDFEKLRLDNYIYVDKTRYIYNLVHMGKPYFLSRPRRFGKSLLLSTIRAYWEGKKELFKGLDIEELEKDNPDAWQEYPVFYFDFNRDGFSENDALEKILEEHLAEWEKRYELNQKQLPQPERFRHIIKTAYERTGKRVVILVDEYDKPLLEVITDNDLEEHNKSVFKGFFSTLKSYDRYIEFEFLTGVTKFSKVSIFSDLNHLRDISLSEEYADICGITETELKNAFMPEVEAMAAKQKMSLEECYEKLEKTYDGYHFNKESNGVYNPFSLINALQAKEFDSYWFSTGTPTFLIKKLNAINFDAKKFTDGNLYADSYALFDYRADNPDPIPLFYQTGYLTIKGYDKKFDSYQLGYPNDEVKYSFIKSLAPSYLHSEDEEPLDIRNFGRDIESANLEGIKDRFTELFARLPYGNDEKYVERDFQNVVYITFMLLGQFVHTEMHTAKGRVDCIVEADDYIYIFEFKRDADADTALAQIEEKGYAKAYAADSRIIIKVGVNFDTESRSISEWKTVE